MADSLLPWDSSGETGVVVADIAAATAAASGSHLRFARQSTRLVSPPGSPYLGARAPIQAYDASGRLVLGAGASVRMTPTASSSSSNYRSLSPGALGERTGGGIGTGTSTSTGTSLATSPSPRALVPSPRIKPEEQELLSASFSWLKTHWTTKEQGRDSSLESKRVLDYEKEESQVNAQGSPILPSYNPCLPPRPRARKTIDQQRSLLLTGLLIAMTLTLFLCLRVKETTPDIRHRGPAIETTSLYRGTTRLIIIAGHAVRSFAPAGSSDLLDPKAWYVQDFVAPGQNGTSCNVPCRKTKIRTFVRHIREGLHQFDLSARGQALLVFSGGQTRVEAGPVSEGLSYWETARAMRDDLATRYITTEEFARDSLENFVFSLARFREMTGHYPDTVTIVGFAFKQKRFLELHAKAAARWNGAIEYIGIDEDTPLSPRETPFFSPLDPLPSEHRASSPPHARDTAYADFAKDLYGCHSPTLIEKRLSRNPWHRQDAYKDTAPEMRALLEYCPSNAASAASALEKTAFRGTLPWK